MVKEDILDNDTEPQNHKRTLHLIEWIGLGANSVKLF